MYPYGKSAFTVKNIYSFSESQKNTEKMVYEGDDIFVFFDAKKCKRGVYSNLGVYFALALSSGVRLGIGTGVRLGIGI